MAANKKSYDELSISEKIEAKKKKIKRLFREMPPEKRQFAEGLINQFAVTSVTLERLADEINNGDLIYHRQLFAGYYRRPLRALRPCYEQHRLSRRLRVRLQAGRGLRCFRASRKGGGLIGGLEYGSR